LNWDSIFVSFTNTSLLEFVIEKLITEQRLLCLHEGQIYSRNSFTREGYVKHEIENEIMKYSGIHFSQNVAWGICEATWYDFPVSWRVVL